MEAANVPLWLGASGWEVSCFRFPVSDGQILPRGYQEGKNYPNRMFVKFQEWELNWFNERAGLEVTKWLSITCYSEYSNVTGAYWIC